MTESGRPTPESFVAPASELTVDERPQSGWRNFLDRPFTTTPRKALLIAAGIVIGTAAGWFAADLLKMAGTNPQITSETALTAWRATSAFFGGFFGLSLGFAAGVETPPRPKRSK